MFIKSNDVRYASNRIIKSKTNLRYIYRIHEVITPVNNINVIIPFKHATIFDYHNGVTTIAEYHQLQHCFEMLHCGDRYELIDGNEVELHDSHEFCEDLFNHCPNHITLKGYFQSEKYFKMLKN